MAGLILLAAAAQSLPEFLSGTCLECHGPEKSKGHFRVDQLPLDFQNESGHESWLKVLEQLESGEMPPDSKPRPAEADIRQISAWIRNQVQAGKSARRATEGRVVWRRLNRVEYQNTLKDLLAIDLDLADLLPADTSSDGFDNIADALHTSSFLMDRYLEAADIALNAAIANGPQPPSTINRFSFQEERRVKIATEKVYKPLEGQALAMFSSSAWTAITTGQFYPRERGRYRIRISLRSFQNEDRSIPVRIEAGPMSMGQKNHLVGYFDAPPEQSRVVEFEEHFEARHSVRVLPYGLQSAQEVNKIGADTYTGAGLVVDWMESEGPLHPVWPPESHRRLFGDLPQKPAPVRDRRQRVEVSSEKPAEDAERILGAFAKRAFRGPVAAEDIAPYMAIFQTKTAEGYSFEAALRASLKGVLMAPRFLFLAEKAGPLDDYALASRLSYFLWSTMPDDELFALAEAKKLRDPAERRRQVERLLTSPKAAAFTENFTGQWLKLRDIDFTAPDGRLYPDYDEMLGYSMVQETRTFFQEILDRDLSLLEFVSSEFSMLNQRLAKHYGIPGVTGSGFRKVTLPAESHRGGVLTMASVLKVTANGTTTSPVTRGAFVLDRILGTPPSNPPDGVPAIEPDIRGAISIRDQLAKHREIASCASCHVKIDPPGFALESFDCIGGWRDHYRSLGSGAVVFLDGRRMGFHQGKAVDASDVMADGRKFQNVDEFKKLLLEDKDQLAYALAARLLTYATGRAPGASDRDSVNALVARCREKNYGFRSLVHEVVASELFLTK